MLATKFWIVLLISMVPCDFAEDCLVKISGEHQIIKDLINTQGYFCSMSVKILNKEKGVSVPVPGQKDYCDLLALVYEVDGLLENLKFMVGTINYGRKKSLIGTVLPCIEELEYTVQEAVSGYLQTVNMNPIEILLRVNDSLHKLDGFKADSKSSSKCESYYNEHQLSNNGITKGPQCACSCSSPTTPISSSATSQTTLSHLSKLASSTYTTTNSFHTSPLAGEMSGSYPEKLISPQKNSQELDSSPFIFTDMSSDLNPLTTIVDRLHAGTTVQPGAFTDFPLTNSDFPMHSTEFKKGIHEPSYVSLNPSQTRTDPEKVNKDASNPDTEGMYESVEASTIENPSVATYSLINGEFSTVMEPDETQETTMSEFGSQSSKGSLFQNSLSAPSKEPGIETPSNSVTKIRRSLGNMDAISRATVMTQAVSSLSASANDPYVPFVNSVHTNIPSTLDEISREAATTQAVSSLSASANDPNLPFVNSVHTNIPSTLDEISREAVTTQAVSSLSASANDPNLPFVNSVHTNIPSNLDAISGAVVTTQAVSSLFTSANDPNLPLLNSVHTNIPSSGTGLSNTESPEPMSQRKIIGNRDLGWASSYLSSTMLTTKPEPPISSSVTGDQQLLSDVAHTPLLNAHKSYNIPPHQERDIAIHGWQNSVSGPNHGSNLLPFIATEYSEDGRKKEHNQSNLQLIINVILVVLVLLFLSGFLYYMHQYRVLKRRLNVSHDLDLTRNLGAVLPEERVHLPTAECDIV